MKIRILSGIIGILLILLCLFTTRPLMIALVSFLMFFSQRELSQMYYNIEKQRLSFLPILGCFFMLILYLIGLEGWAGLASLIYLFFLSSWAIMFFPNVPVCDLTFCLFMYFYGGWTLMHALVLYDAPKGPFLLLAVFIAVWCCDSGAYFVGKALGKHKMAALLSPKKTIEGALGGVVLTVPAIIIYNLYFELFPSMLAAAIFGFLAAVIGIAGDLFESYLKRMYEVKDSGKLIPGHGGILDRFDSFIFVLPLCSFLLPLLPGN